MQPERRTRPGRVKYRVAGAAMRDTLRRANAIAPALGARERAVLEAVLVITASYSRLADWTTAREIAAIAYGVAAEDLDGRDRERAREILNRLHALRLIDITPLGRGRSARLIVSLRPGTPPPNGSLSDEETEGTPPSGGRNTPLGVTRTPPTGAAHREDSREDSREEISPAFGGTTEIELSDATDLAVDPVRAVFDAWIHATGRTPRTILDQKRRRLIVKALEAYTVDEVLAAVRGWRHSPHHCGANPAGTIYNDLELLLRDAQHIERFRDLELTDGQAGRRPILPKGAAAVARAVERARASEGATR